MIDFFSLTLILMECLVLLCQVKRKTEFSRGLTPMTRIKQKIFKINI